MAAPCYPATRCQCTGKDGEVFPWHGSTARAGTLGDTARHGSASAHRCYAETAICASHASPKAGQRQQRIAEGSAVLHQAVADLFSGDAETALLYFAGHGIINPDTNAGYIVSQDGQKGAWGLALSEILGLANNVHPRIKSSVIILDSCHSGYAGEVSGLPVGNPSIIVFLDLAKVP